MLSKLGDRKHKLDLVHLLNTSSLILSLNDCVKWVEIKKIHSLGFKLSSVGEAINLSTIGS